MRSGYLMRDEFGISFAKMLGFKMVVALRIGIEAIKKAAYSGKIGDGKIFVSDETSAVRIRTGETGVDAL